MSTDRTTGEDMGWNSHPSEHCHLHFDNLRGDLPASYVCRRLADILSYQCPSQLVPRTIQELMVSYRGHNVGSAALVTTGARLEVSYGYAVASTWICISTARKWRHSLWLKGLVHLIGSMLVSQGTIPNCTFKYWQRPTNILGEWLSQYSTNSAN